MSGQEKPPPPPHPDTRVELTADEVLLGAIGGVMRHAWAISKRLNNAHGASNALGWQMHVEGALAERALSKFLNVYWTGKNNLGGRDVGNLYECRSSPNPNGALILHRRDPERVVFFRVTGLEGVYYIQGWIRARDGKIERFWQKRLNNRSAYFVPQWYLNNPLVPPP